MLNTIGLFLCAHLSVIIPPPPPYPPPLAPPTSSSLGRIPARLQHLGKSRLPPCCDRCMCFSTVSNKLPSSLPLVTSPESTRHHEDCICKLFNSSWNPAHRWPFIIPKMPSVSLLFQTRCFSVCSFNDVSYCPHVPFAEVHFSRHETVRVENKVQLTPIHISAMAGKQLIYCM